TLCFCEPLFRQLPLVSRSTQWGEVGRFRNFLCEHRVHVNHINGVRVKRLQERYSIRRNHLDPLHRLIQMRHTIVLPESLPNDVSEDRMAFAAIHLAFLSDTLRSHNRIRRQAQSAIQKRITPLKAGYVDQRILFKRALRPERCRIRMKKERLAFTSRVKLEPLLQTDHKIRSFIRMHSVDGTFIARDLQKRKVCRNTFGPLQRGCGRPVRGCDYLLHWAATCSRTCAKWSRICSIG